MPKIEWNPNGKEEYAIFPGVVIIDPDNTWRDETGEAWVVPISRNACALTVFLPRCSLPSKLQEITGKKEGLVATSPIETGNSHEQDRMKIVAAIKKNYMEKAQILIQM